MSKDLAENLASTNSEKKYTSQELIRGFASFPSPSDEKDTSEFTKHWLWHSLMLCQHYIYKERTLSKNRIREILTLQVDSNEYQAQERKSYNWLRDEQAKHPEIKDLVEALLRFLETNNENRTSKNRPKSAKDYMGFGVNTLYVMASAGVASLFLPSVIVAGVVFIGAIGTGLVVKNYLNRSKKNKFNNSVKKKIIEIDNMSTNEQGKQIVDLIAANNYQPFLLHADLKSNYEKLVTVTRRFAALYQKHSSNWEAALTVESVWKNSMPALLGYDFEDPDVRNHINSTMEKMLFLVNRYVQDMMRIELNELKVEDEFWKTKVSSEMSSDNVKID